MKEKNSKNEILISKIKLSKKSSTHNLLSFSKNEKIYYCTNKTRKRSYYTNKMNSAYSLYPKTLGLYINNIKMKTKVQGRI